MILTKLFNFELKKEPTTNYYIVSCLLSIETMGSHCLC